MTSVTDYVGKFHGGYGSGPGKVWSETSPDYDTALEAAKFAPQRQHVAALDNGPSIHWRYGRWRAGHYRGGDRPKAQFTDDGKGSTK